MIDQRRRRNVKDRPETMGLSTLDTVTCALAGSIVLLLILSAVAPPAAPAQLAPERLIAQSGQTTGTGDESAAGDAGETVAAGGEADPAPVGRDNVAVLFLTLEGGNGITAASVSGLCAQGASAQVLHSAGHHFGAPGDTNPAVALWLGARHTNCGELTVTFTFESAARSSCGVTLVSAGHYQSNDYRRCPAELRLTTADSVVFLLSRT